MKKLFYLVAIIALTCADAHAYTPFDIFDGSRPDFIIRNISLASNSDVVNMEICNVGDAMNAGGELVYGVKGQFGGEVKIIKNLSYVKYAAGECNTYAVGRISDFGISGNGTYGFKGAVKINSSDSESNYGNNQLERTVSVNYWSSSSYASNYNYYPSSIDYGYYPQYGYGYAPPDFALNSLEYRDSYTNDDGANEGTQYYGVVARICNLGSAYAVNTNIKVSFKAASGNKEVYREIQNSNRTWGNGECRNIGVPSWDLGLQGDMYTNVTAKVDDNNQIRETDESNNVFTKYLFVSHVRQGGADGYYCNGRWFSYGGQQMQGYNCNGTWYNRAGWDNRSNNRGGPRGEPGNKGNPDGKGVKPKDAGQHRKGSNQPDVNGYTCNGVYFRFESGETGYRCNGTWYSRYGENSHSYYCNGKWNQSSYEKGYYCNDVWYYFKGSENTNYGNEGYYCNDKFYNYSSADNGYYCNGTWNTRYGAGNRGSDSQGYTCGGVYYRFSSDLVNGYYCNGTWFPRQGFDSNQVYYRNISPSGNRQYSCNGNIYTSQYSNGYYCNNVWYNFDANQYPYYDNQNINYNSGNGSEYFCNGTRYTYGYNENGYYCNGTWYSRYSSAGNQNTGNAGDIRVIGYRTSVENSEIGATVCNETSQPSYFKATVEFYSASTGRTAKRYVTFNLSAKSCVSNVAIAKFNEMGIYYDGSYSIRTRIIPDGSYGGTYYNFSSAERTDTIIVRF